MSLIYVTNSTTTGSTSTAPGISLTSASTTSSIVMTSAVLMLDGYQLISGTLSPKANCTFFNGIVNFVLTNPIYSTDEQDVVTCTVQLYNTFNQSQCYSIYCSLSNLGRVVYSPVYNISTAPSSTTTCTNAPSTTSFTIPINKWFAFTSPGSTYQFCVYGLNQLSGKTVSSCSSCVSVSA